MMQTALKRRVASHGDTADDLILGHLPLVRRLAWHVHGRISSAGELEELMQAGMLSLVEAAHAFEDRGHAFATYASVRIKGAMIDHLRRSSGRSRTASTARRAIEAARRAIEAEVAGPARAADIADRMAISLEAYHDLERVASSGVTEPLDDAYSDIDIAYCDPAERQDDALARQCDYQALRDAIATLDPRSQMVLQLYFFEEMNLEEIGRVLDVGAARICQIKSAALAKLAAKATIRQA